ncbi:IS605 OrfB family transposase [Streptomyces sp. DSM 40167]|nr:IS605 OrfB family transposase [Streptomyces sp. DSM 40167]
MYRRVEAGTPLDPADTWRERLLKTDRGLRASLLGYRHGARVFNLVLRGTPGLHLWEESHPCGRGAERPGVVSGGGRRWCAQSRFTRSGDQEGTCGGWSYTYERTGRGIALEDLTGIRERVRLRKPQRATHSSWAFAQLGQFIAYKARKAGVPVVHVDPAYTSRTCAECGYIDKANRVSQAWFACRSCGFVDHADQNGSRNIRARAWELWRRGAPSTAPAPSRTPRSGTGRKRSITASDARCANLAP